jgi:predicted RNA methylase
MKSVQKNAGKELYRRLRNLSCTQLWEQEVARFDRAAPLERIETVGVIRAVGVVFSESGTPEQREVVKTWLRGLLHDPSEKIRRYAIAALPKIGAGTVEEAELLSLWRAPGFDREKKFLGLALEKIGGKATLEHLGPDSAGSQIEQKLRASLARDENPSEIQMDRQLSGFSVLRIQLRGRRGLEEIVRSEVEESVRKTRLFRIEDVRAGLVTLIPLAPFTIGDIYKFRCFGTVGFEVGGTANIDELASLIVSPLSRRILETFTTGSLRYRLDFPSRGHQRGAVKALAHQVYSLCPSILNSAQNAPWTILINSWGKEHSVELSPRHSVDPRFCYRQQDVPAASHPPLAACMARLAGQTKDEIVWDPFCGSGLELVERALLGSVKQVYGTDRSEEAISIAERNFAGANLLSVAAKFVCCDFRDFAKIEKMERASVTLVISNPPMGKRVHIPNLRGLTADFFKAAAAVLRPGGRLVFANPLWMESPLQSLKLQSRRVIDFGGFNCRLELYTKVAQGSAHGATRATPRKVRS